MLQNFLFSISVSMPIFILLIVGWVLKKRNVVDEHFFSSANKLIFQVALPAKLFLDTATSDFKKALDWRFIFFAVLCTTIIFIGGWILGSLILKDPSKVGAFAHGAFRGNYVYIGFALMQNILGQNTIPASAPLVGAFVLPLYNIYAVIVLTVTNHPGSRIDFKSIFISIIKNPMILGIAAGLLFALLEIPLPFVFTKSLEYLGDIATPLALLSIGASIQFASIKKDLKPILIACFYKLVLQPAVVVPLAMKAGFQSEQILVLFVLFGVPSAANVYIVTKSMGGDAQMGAGIIVVSILLSTITLTFGIFLLKTLSII